MAISKCHKDHVCAFASMILASDRQVFAPICKSYCIAFMSFSTSEPVAIKSPGEDYYRSAAFGLESLDFVRNATPRAKIM